MSEFPEICIYFAISKDKGEMWYFYTKIHSYIDMRAISNLWDKAKPIFFLANGFHFVHS